MKKILALLIAATLVLSLAGCGVKEKASEKIAEKIVEEAIGGKVDVDGDKVTIKGEDGTEVKFGGTEWPKTDLMKNIPEFKDGTIATVMESDKYAMVVIEKVKEEDATKYLDEMKKTFTKNSFSMDSDGVTTYMAGNDNDLSVQVTYDSGEETFSIALTQAEK